MDKRNTFIGSTTVMVIGLILMGINWFILPFPDLSVRVIGIIMLINIPILVYSAFKLNPDKKHSKASNQAS